MMGAGAYGGDQFDDAERTCANGNAPRKRRIAQAVDGSRDVNRLLKQFDDMRFYQR